MPGTSQNSNNVFPKVIVCIRAFEVDPGTDATGHALRPRRALIRLDFPALSRPFKDSNKKNTVSTNIFSRNPHYEFGIWFEPIPITAILTVLCSSFGILVFIDLNILRLYSCQSFLYSTSESRDLEKL